MASAEVRSGCADLNRGLSSGVQAWDTDESQWPISKPVEKYEAKIQCAGEATYVNDIPASQGELHAAFVLTSRANCDIAAVDPAAALVRNVQYISISGYFGTETIIILSFHFRHSLELFLM